jgi:hypothetical protein
MLDCSAAPRNVVALAHLRRPGACVRTPVCRNVLFGKSVVAHRRSGAVCYRAGATLPSLGGWRSRRMLGHAQTSAGIG